MKILGYPMELKNRNVVKAKQTVQKLSTRVLTLSSTLFSLYYLIFSLLPIPFLPPPLKPSNLAQMIIV